MSDLRFNGPQLATRRTLITAIVAYSIALIFIVWMIGFLSLPKAEELVVPGKSTVAPAQQTPVNGPVEEFPVTEGHDKG